MCDCRFRLDTRTRSRTSCRLGNSFLLDNPLESSCSASSMIPLDMSMNIAIIQTNSSVTYFIFISFHHCTAYLASDLALFILVCTRCAFRWLCTAQRTFRSCWTQQRIICHACTRWAIVAWQALACRIHRTVQWTVESSSARLTVRDMSQTYRARVRAWWTLNWSDAAFWTVVSWWTDVVLGISFHTSISFVRSGCT